MSEEEKEFEENLKRDLEQSNAEVRYEVVVGVVIVMVGSCNDSKQFMTSQTNLLVWSIERKFKRKCLPLSSPSTSGSVDVDVDVDVDVMWVWM